MAGETLLDIRDLHAAVEGREILAGVSLAVPVGEVHAVMGPNGSGKSTLSFVLAGREGYAVTAGSVLYRGRDLLSMPPEDRAREGVFLAFQYPVEIPGVPVTTFLRATVNAQRRARGEAEIDPMAFVDIARRKAQDLGIGPDLLRRAVNMGFSGGEKKRFEILQMALLDPRLMILDETDSGLDIDALKVVAAGIEGLRGPGRGMLVITHYQRILDYVAPDRVHVLSGGRVVESGGPDLARDLERTGYARYAGRAA